MTEETTQIGDAVNADVKHPVDTGGGGEANSDDAVSNSENVFIESGDSINIPISKNHKIHALTSDSEEGFLSTSPDSINGCDAIASTSQTQHHQQSCAHSTIISKHNLTVITPPPPISLCTNPAHCVTLKNILDSFKAPLSEEQSWALLYQFMSLYRSIAATGTKHIFSDLEIPDSMENMCLHRDGSVHCIWSEAERRQKEQQAREERLQQTSEEEQADDHHVLLIHSHKKILSKVAVCVYTALDYNLQADEQCHMSQELEELITLMTGDETDEDCIDEGIDEGYKRWDEESDERYCETKEFDIVLEACKNHIKPTVPDEHYKAVCRALVTETIELRIFLQQVLTDGAESLRQKADTQTSKQELANLGFNEWARFWVQVIDELRHGVRLKKSNYSRTPIEYELTPYEILMEDIRSKKYQLRKVMVNGDIPPRVKKDAHAVILEFIRSRPPLKKASERQLAPPVTRNPSPREQLMDSIRKGQTLKHIPPPPIKERMLPPTQSNSITDSSYDSLDALKLQENQEPNVTPRSKQRLIKVDFSLLQLVCFLLRFSSTPSYLLHKWD